MEKREQGTGYRFANEKQPVRNVTQANALRTTTGVRNTNTMGQSTSVRNTNAVGQSTSVRNTNAVSQSTSVRNTNAVGQSASVRKVAATSATGVRSAGRTDSTAKARTEQEEKVKAVKASGKPDIRLLLISLMGIFVVVVMGWGICQHVKSINTRGELITYEAAQSIKKIEDNSENAGKAIDVDKLIQKVLDNVVFEAELNKLDDSVAEGMIETTEGTKLSFYVGQGTYADELIVMTAKSEEDARQNQENAKMHLSETKKAFQDYVPEEAEKIDNAVSIRCGCYVIVCVTADYDKAEKTINAMIQE